MNAKLKIFHAETQRSFACIKTTICGFAVASLREQKSRHDRLGTMILNLVNLRLKQDFETKVIRQTQIHELLRLKRETIREK